MATLADIQAKTAALIASVQANTDATASLKIYVEGIKAQLVDVQTQLDAAIAGNDPSALQAVSDNLGAVTTSINADTAAEAALSNTPAAPADPTST